MSKTMIIPDIHNRIDRIETIIDSVNPDKIVFLGDYFDSFGDSGEMTDQTAYWLESSLKKENRLHLVGNHDLSYMTDLEHLRSSGYTEYKKFIIKRHNIPWERLYMYCYVGDWLCTHAGVSRQFFEQHSGTDLCSFMAESIKDVKHINDPTYDHRFFHCGISRGGRHQNGGIVWCDYNEFVDIPNQKQIFGHTYSQHVRQTENHICLDTGSENYAIYEDSKMQVKSMSDLGD